MCPQKKSVEAIFHDALEIAAEHKRSKYLDDVCAGDSRLRVQVDEMLRAYERAVDFLERPPTLVDVDLNARSTGDAELDPTQPPKRQNHSQVDQDSGGLPRFFGDYELLEKVARGGMGVVYKARQTSLNRIVAIKMILAGQFAGDDEVRRFYIEAEAAAHLDHPGIVPVYDVGCYEGQHYFAMGFVEGETLADKVKQGPLPPRVAAMYVKKIASAVQVAHDQGIIHRDLKPGNVLLDKQGEPKITDFGLAKRVEANSKLTATGMVIGTPSYMPPEQASGKLDQINASADIYSLGAVLYSLLTGRPPFNSKTQVDTLMQVLQEEPVAPRQVVSSIPRDLEVISLKCLEKQPRDRYASAADLADDLQQFLAGEPIGAKNDWMRRVRKWTIREPVLASHLGATLIMMVFICLNYLLWGRSGPDAEHSLWLLKINGSILGAWALTVLVLQKCQNIFQAPMALPFLWAAINPIFLTTIIGVNDVPRGSLFSLYLLLMIATCFFRRVELVVVTTIGSLIGYLFLVILFFKQETEFNPAIVKGTPNSYLVIIGASLGVAGLMLTLLTIRLKRLSQKDSL